MDKKKRRKKKMSKKENKTQKDYVETKIQEIKDEYGLEEVEDISSESKRLDVGDHIAGEFLGLTQDVDNEGNEINLILIRNKQGLFSIKESYELARMIKTVEKGTQIAILCHDTGESAGGRVFKKFKLFKVK
jgi:hypothetical protein